MARFAWPNKKRLSYRDESARVRQSMDPLDFLSADSAGLSTRDAFQQIHAVMHGALEDVEKGIQLVFEQLRPEGAVADRVILEANGEIRNELVRASFLADEKKDELTRDIRARLENLYVQGLIVAPHQDPAIRRWENLSARAIQRDLPSIIEYSHADLARPEDRRRRLPRWQQQIDEWLETMCRNHVADVIKDMEEEIKEFVGSWFEVTAGLRRRASLGGSLFQQVIDPDLWTFESEDPTVRNLLRGQQAQSIATRILERFQISSQDVTDVAETVRASLQGLAVYGTNRVGIQELEDLLALALSEKIQDTVSLEAGFLSVISNGVRYNEELGELLAEMHRGAAAMEQKVWRVGEVGVGHVDSASGVGITASNVHDIVVRGLGGGRRFAAVEGHPGDNHRFDVQMSIVGAPASDLTIFREMVTAWYQWHFSEDRAECKTEAEWLELVKSECWKLYPDIGTDSGVRNAIIELIGEDLAEMWRSREGMVPRLTNGLPSEEDLLHGLWRELGVITDGVVKEVKN